MVSKQVIKQMPDFKVKEADLSAIAIKQRLNNLRIKAVSYTCMQMFTL